MGSNLTEFQFLCLKNICAFLSACKTAFHVPKDLMFQVCYFEFHAIAPNIKYTNFELFAAGARAVQRDRFRQGAKYAVLGIGLRHGAQTLPANRVSISLACRPAAGAAGNMPAGVTYLHLQGLRLLRQPGVGLHQCQEPAAIGGRQQQQRSVDVTIDGP